MVKRKKRVNKFEASLGPPESATAMLRLDLLRTYKLDWLPGDLLAGFIMCAVAIPVALAYGQLSGLQPVNGLYAALAAMGVYALFGTSRQLVIGPEASVSILVATSVAAMNAGGDPARFATLVMMQAIMVGIILLATGVFRVGFISDFIPKSVVAGFINGLGLIIILSQVGRLAGIELQSVAFFSQIWELASRYHEAHLLTLYVGGGCLLAMLVIPLLLRWVPEIVLVVLAATLVVMKWDLGTQGVQLIGLVPAGLPHPIIPDVGFNDILTMLPVAAGVALVACVGTIKAGRALAMRGGYGVDANQELIALGLAHTGTGVCQGFAIGPCHACTAVNVSYGGRSQVAVFLATVLLGCFLLYLTDILKSVPSVALSALIMLAGIRLLSLREIIDTFKTRRASCYVCLATTGAVLITGLMTGILVAVALAIILVLSALVRPHESVDRPRGQGMLVYRFAGPLFFLNATYFANRVQEFIDSSPEPVKVFLINAEAIVDMDVNAAEILEDLQFSLKNQGIVLAMCEVRGNFLKGLKTTLLPGRADFVIYPSVEAAMRELGKEPPKVEPPKVEPPKEELLKEEPPKAEPPEEELPKEETPKTEPPKEELPKVEVPKEELPKEEPPKEEKKLKSSDKPGAKS